MNRHLLTLIVLAIIGSAIAAWLITSTQQVNDFDSDILLPQLSQNGYKVSSIKVETAGGVVATVSNQGEQWQLEQSQYPADTSSIASLIKALQLAKKVEAKTANPTYFHKLALTDISQSESQATRITINQGAEAVALLIGKSNASSGGQFVRMQKSEQSWLIDRPIPVPQSAEQWLRKALIPDAFRQPTLLARAGEQGWQIRLQDGEYRLEDVAESQALRYPSIAQSTVESLLQTQVQSLANEQQWQQAEPMATFTLTNETGQLTIALARYQNQIFARLTSDDHNGYWQGRIYLLSEFVVNQFNLVKSDFYTGEEQESQTP